MSEKICKCSDGPTVTQSVPVGFSGTVQCAKCGGAASWPRPGKKYDGKDEVEGYLFEISKNLAGLNFENAVLKMLLRIEKAIQGKK